MSIDNSFMLRNKKKTNNEPLRKKKRNEIRKQNANATPLNEPMKKKKNEMKKRDGRIIE